MSLDGRRSMIETLIREDGEIEIASLAERFDVSEMTIRRDLDALELRGVLRRVIGARAVAVDHKSLEPSFVTRALEKSASKAHIGEAVAGRLGRHEAVFFDGGSTALAAARAVRGRALGLTVLTRSLFVALELADEPNSEVFLLGGRVKSGEMVSIATFEDELARYNIDTYVMGISGVHATRGLTDYDPNEIAGKRMAMQQADRVILGFDKTKLDRVLLARVAGIEEIDIVITDADRNHPALTSMPPGVDIEFLSGTDEPGFAGVDRVTTKQEEQL